MDVRLRKAAAKQDDIVAAWQLTAAGWDWNAIRYRVRRDGWRRIHDGVWALNQAPLTQRQLRIAAVLTAPRTFLAAESACAHHGFLEWDGGYETVVRPGSGGRRRYAGLRVTRSMTLAGQTGVKDGIPLVCAERALIDVAPRLDFRHLGRGFREACRIGATTPNLIARQLRGQRGTRLLGALCDRYATIPYHRCRSDAESRALEVLHDAGVLTPRVNVRVAGREADLVWRERRLIVEVDSKAFHPFAIDDADKQKLWEAAGYRVGRIMANDVYFRPDRLLALVNGPIRCP